MLSDIFRLESKIGLLIDRSTVFGRGVLVGISEISREHPRIRFHIEAPTDEGISELANWGAQGIIAMIHTLKMERALDTLGIPIVHVCSATGKEALRVHTDDETVGQMAAEHLLESDVETFGYVGLQEGTFVHDRAQGFQKAIEEAGRTVHFFNESRSELEPWLRRMNKPLAIMACNDTIGRLVLEQCLEMKLNVPEDVLIIGVDNDESVCELTRPGLSSITLDTAGIGRSAMELLWRALRGQVSERSTLLAPVGLNIRGSTVQQTVDDPIMLKVVSDIQLFARDSQKVRQILEGAPISRMTIERRFRRLVGRTPFDEIRRIRINQAKELLSTTNLPLKAIADECGYTTPTRLIEAFIKETGLTPTEYRTERKIGSTGSHFGKRIQKRTCTK